MAENNEVIINGIKYAPVATSMHAYYMHDNHTFSKLKDSTLEEMIVNATKIADKSSFGMLCPIILKSGDKELRRVGPCVHHNPKNPEQWTEGCQNWLNEVKSDIDVIRLMRQKIK